jgi:hypothetical protein
MQLVYSTPEETTITVTLDDGESLDDLVGPIVVHVPTDPLNRHYAEIVEGNYTVDPYVEPPVTLPSTAIADSSDLAARLEALEAMVIPR